MQNTKLKFILIVFLVFCIGLLIGGVVTQASSDMDSIITYVVKDSPDSELSLVFDEIVEKELPAGTAREVSSPKDRIGENQIHVYNNQIVLDIKNAEWATFTDTNSMDPVLDAGANAIELVPKSSDEIQVGDIVSYRSKYAKGVLIHRVVEIGHDISGWYAVMKGDNNPDEDPGKIRFSQIERVVVAIIY